MTNSYETDDERIEIPLCRTMSPCDVRGDRGLAGANGDAPSRRREWAKAALDSFAKDHSAMGVDAALANVARADDPYLRSLTALALNFWDGPQTEPALLRLARDRGRGELIKITEND